MLFSYIGGYLLIFMLKKKHKKKKIGKNAGLQPANETSNFVKGKKKKESSSPEGERSSSNENTHSARVARTTLKEGNENLSDNYEQQLSFSQKTKGFDTITNEFSLPLQKARHCRLKRPLLRFAYKNDKTYHQSLKNSSNQK